MGLRAERIHTFHNGPLECRLLRFQVEPAFFVDRDAADRRARTVAANQAGPYRCRESGDIHRRRGFCQSAAQKPAPP